MTQVYGPISQPRSRLGFNGMTPGVGIDCDNQPIDQINQIAYHKHFLPQRNFVANV